MTKTSFYLDGSIDLEVPDIQFGASGVLKWSFGAVRGGLGALGSCLGAGRLGAWEPGRLGTAGPGLACGWGWLQGRPGRPK